MRVINLTGRNNSYVAIAPKEKINSNWITVITGVNGTRKSTILRLISSAALGSAGVRIGNILFSPIDIDAIGAEEVNRVIAISGTPFDRFAKANIKRIFSEDENKISDPAYAYFGFKSANGATGAIGIMKVIGSLLWKRRNKLRNRKNPLNSIFKFLNLHPNVEVKIRRSPALNSTSRIANKDGLKRGDFDSLKLMPFLLSLIEKFESENSSELLDFIKFIIRSKARILKLEKFLDQFPSGIKYDFKSGDATEEFKMDGDFDIEKLIESGILVINDLLVARTLQDSETEIEQISASSLSSGQWQLLLGFLGLGLEIEDDTTILIDEPENSLHPEWQRQYIELLEEVIAERKRCHVIIATHSPLITSGVNGEKGNLIRLVPNSLSSFGVISEDLAPNFGWDVNKTLEILFEMKNTRGSSFVEMVDKALAMIRDQDTESREFFNLATKIVGASSHMPDGDPMLQISRAIGKLIKNK